MRRTLPGRDGERLIGGGLAAQSGRWKTVGGVLVFYRLLVLAMAFAGGVVPLAAASPLESLGRLQAFDAQRASSSSADLNRNGDARPIPPGETLVLGELEGPGAITHLWCTVGMDDISYPRALVVRMYWDGSEAPSVEAPLGDFFGVGHGAFADFTSLPVATSSRGRARNCFWYMPFAESARVTVTNESDVRCDSFYYYLDWRQLEAAPEDLAYFHALYRQAHPPAPGDYTILETEGRGHYVGTVYSAQMMEVGWFGEGDDRFYVDGEATRSLRGTGTEDYFSDAWGFRAFSQPFHGVSLWDGYFPGDRATAYRWHIDSPLPFDEELRVTIEHRGSVFTDTAGFLGQFLERSDWVSSVAFWYQTPPIGPSEPLPPYRERVAPYRLLEWADVHVEADPLLVLLKNDDGVTYMPTVDDGSITFSFTVDEPGRYQINAIMIYGVAGGVYQPFVDDAPVGGPIDFCATGQDPEWTRFDLHDFEAGTHTLRFEGRGPSPNKRTMAPPVYGLGMTYLVLLRLDDMEGYQAALQRALEQASTSSPAAAP